MAKNRVLVVDDEPDVLMLTCTALEDAGFDVIAQKTFHTRVNSYYRRSRTS